MKNYRYFADLPLRTVELRRNQLTHCIPTYPESGRDNALCVYVKNKGSIKMSLHFKFNNEDYADECVADGYKIPPSVATPAKPLAKLSEKLLAEALSQINRAFAGAE